MSGGISGLNGQGKVFYGSALPAKKTTQKKEDNKPVIQMKHSENTDCLAGTGLSRNGVENLLLNSINYNFGDLTTKYRKN